MENSINDFENYLSENMKRLSTETIPLNLPDAKMIRLKAIIDKRESAEIKFRKIELLVKFLMIVILSSIGISITVFHGSDQVLRIFSEHKTFRHIFSYITSLPLPFIVFSAAILSVGAFYWFYELMISDR